LKKRASLMSRDLMWSSNRNCEQTKSFCRRYLRGGGEVREGQKMGPLCGVEEAARPLQERPREECHARRELGPWTTLPTQLTHWYVKLTVVFMMPMPCVRIDEAMCLMPIVERYLASVSASTKSCWLRLYLDGGQTRRNRQLGRAPAGRPRPLGGI